MGTLWLIATIVFTVAEALTYQFISIWFAGGSIGALIAYLLNADFFTQVLVFITVSVILLVISRPIVNKWTKNRVIEKTNIDALIGKTALITDTIDNIMGTGQVKVNGITWTARSADNSKLEIGEIVTIQKIDGVKLIVTK